MISESESAANALFQLAYNEIGLKTSCSICGAAKGKPCVETDDQTYRKTTHGNRDAKAAKAAGIYDPKNEPWKKHWAIYGPPPKSTVD